MSLNHPFILDQVRRRAGEHAAVLDFGCGQGEFVALARHEGFAAQGCDWYAGPWAWLFEDVKKNAALRDHVKQIEPDGRLPFPDASFEAVTSNMVFEHVVDFEKPVGEIARVLKAGGLFVVLFPSRELWFEQHVGLPLAHRIPSPGYFAFAHRLGLGWARKGLSREAWVARSVASMRDEVAYRPACESEALFGAAFDVVQRAEADWIRYRVAHSRLRPLGVLIAPRVFDPLLRFLCRRLATMVLVLRKR
jgi:SAM-dependent methyltransferase